MLGNWECHFLRVPNNVRGYQPDRLTQHHFLLLLSQSLGRAKSTRACWSSCYEEIPCIVSDKQEQRLPKSVKTLLDELCTNRLGFTHFWQISAENGNKNHTAEYAERNTNLWCCFDSSLWKNNMIGLVWSDATFSLAWSDSGACVK